MKALFWIGLVVMVLGIASLVLPIPDSESHGIEVGDVSLGVETQSNEKVSPVISGILILGGAAMMIGPKLKKA